MSRSKLHPFKGSNSCPICGEADSDCRYSTDGELVLCHSHIGFDPNHPDWHFLGDSSNGVWGKFVPRKSEAFDRTVWLEKKLQREIDRLERQKEHAKNALSIPDRDKALRKLSQSLGLSRRHRQALLDRGLSESQIETGLFFSIYPNDDVPPGIPPNLPGVNNGKIAAGGVGIACLAFDSEGRAIGYQIRLENVTDSKYRWAKGLTSSHLPDGELPITHIPNGKDNGQVWLSEGILKPFVAAHKHGLNAIGAAGGYFSGAANQIKNAIGPYRQLILCPDAGDINNPQVMLRWSKEIKFLESLGKSVLVAFWGQKTKDDDDIDEIGNLESIEFITPSQFLEMGKSDPLPFWEKVKRLVARDRKKNRKPLPSPLPNNREAKIYDRSNRLNEWASGKYILDTSPTGSGKSYDAGKATPEMMGVTDIIYVNNDPRNVSTPTLKDWPILEGRHAGLYRNELGEIRTRKRKDSLDRFQEKDLRANCARPFTHAALANQNISHGIESATICQGCQFLELCRSGKGDYDYLQKRAIALQSKRLIAHPASLPNPKSYDPENGFDYGNTTLIFEESELSANTTKIVKVSVKDITASIASLAEKDSDLFLSLKPLLIAIKKLIAEKQSNRYGFDGKTLREKLLGLIPNDIDLNRLKSALTPDLSFLDPISEMGESIADMPASVRRAFAEKDSNLAEKAENETLKQWLPELIDSLQGRGYLSLNHGILSVSFVDSRFLAIINEAAKIIFLSATESLENLEARTGLTIDLITTGGDIPENINFIQVIDLGRMGINRGEGQKRRSKVILDHYRETDPNNTAVIRFQSHCKDEDDQTSLKHFVNSQGTNLIAGVTRLIIDGLPCPNLESLRHDYAVSTGLNPYGEDFDRYTRHRILSIIKQEIGRLRANLYPDRIFEVVLLTDYDFSGLIPPNQIKQVKAHEITPDAESVKERTNRLIGEAANRLWETGEKVTERAIATVTGMARTTINRCRAFLDEILATFTISNPNSNCGQAETLTQTDTDLINDATVYLEAASEDSLLTEFGNILEVLDRNQWAALWGFIPIPIRDKLLNQLLAIAT
ncbi:MAG: hypothetical protein PX481_17295 [Microcystis sp. M53603_WE2]|jgi:hypothetical protein|uniref:hypothetical protein n=1 Tax=unclassified Microcystis TaxID=2643300 RepID=UPI002588900A|nr:MULTISPECIES: hypothetical protein [unclassified Microcystis]MDJ0540396.1 hypothetical protein [Microcystis sp. M53603_WE2]MDJ0606209.1 hypothetical protein [Microcystis sp. M53602_WE12]